MGTVYPACSSPDASEEGDDNPKDKYMDSESYVDTNSEDGANTDVDTDEGMDTASEDVSPYIEEGGCELITVTSAKISSKISTVGIVEWEADGDVSSAYIEFGPAGGDYRWQAPVDLTEPGYRTLLIGMKTDSEYKYRVVATIDGDACVSGTGAIQTGELPVGLPNFYIKGQSSGGFIVTTSYMNFVMSNSMTWNGAFILDEDGDYVWWYNPDATQSDWVRARISYDGKYMWLANGNVVEGSDENNNGVVVKVRMDGTGEEVISLPKRHHDLLELPFDGILAFMAFDDSGTGICDDIMERAADGTTSLVFNVGDHFAHRATESEWCHTNAINYVESEDAYYASVLYQNMIIKINRSTGNLEWTMGGLDTDFPGVSWSQQHQHHLLEDSILIFNNSGGATDPSTEDSDEPAGGGFWNIGDTSHAVEYTFDEEAKTASLIWDYDDGATGSFAMGDVKRLPNGNTQIVYSVSGVIKEVTPDKEEIFKIRRNGFFGYASRRESLYSVPPEYEYYPKR
jgi:hypothetical protein